jgi:hypothetical protein
LGAVKKAAPVNFEEVERRAADEAEQSKQLDSDQSWLEVENEKKLPNDQDPKAIEVASISKTPPSVDKTVDKKSIGNAADIERLGMGSKRLGFGQAPGAGASSKSRLQLLFNFPETAFSFDECFTARRMQMMPPPLRESVSETRRPFHRICTLGETYMTLLPYPRLRLACKLSEEPQPFLPMRTSVVMRKRTLAEAA